MSLILTPVATSGPVISPKVISPKIEQEYDLTKRIDIQAYIAEEAFKKAVLPQIALSIAKAESNFYPEAKNPVGTASGVYQFLDSTFQNYCIKSYNLTTSMADKNDVKIQVECALQIMATDEKGIGHWNASRDSWGK